MLDFLDESEYMKDISFMLNVRNLSDFCQEKETLFGFSKGFVFLFYSIFPEKKTFLLIFWRWVKY